MNVGKVFIVGVIGGDEGISLLDVVSQVEAEKHKKPDLDTIDVDINSPGGRVEVGDDMYDYFQSLKSQYTVNTRSSGEISSIASKIFLVGTARRMRRGDEALIHNPWVDPGPANADKLEFNAEELRKIEKSMIKFYVDITGVDESAIKSIMREETVLTAEDAKKLNFATEVIERELSTTDINIDGVGVESIHAFAYVRKDKKETKIKINKSTKITDMSIKIKDAMALLEKFVNGENVAVALDVKGADGTIYRSTAETMEEMVGSTLTVLTEDGEVPTPSDTYVLEDGSALVTDENSMVTEVIPAEEMKEKTDLENMQATLDEANAKITDLTTTNGELVEQLKVVQSDEFKESVEALRKGQKENEATKAELKNLKSHFELDETKTFLKSEIKKEVSASTKMQERKKGYTPKKQIINNKI